MVDLLMVLVCLALVVAFSVRARHHFLAGRKWWTWGMVETLRRMRSVVEFHIEGLRLEGLRVPRPRRTLASVVRQRGAEQRYTMLSVAP
jgi:hypothetical protein